MDVVRSRDIAFMKRDRAEALYPTAVMSLLGTDPLAPWGCSPAAPMTEAQLGSKARISSSSLLQGNGMCMYSKSCFIITESFRLEKIYKIIELKCALEMERKCCKL